MAKVRAVTKRDFDRRSWGISILFATIVRLNEWTSENFSAPYWRIYHNEQKGAFIRTPLKTHPIDPRYIYIVPPNTTYSSWLTKPVSHFFIHFTVDCGFENPEDTIHKVKVDSAMEDLLRIKQDGDTGIQSTFRLHSLIFLVLSQICGWNENQFHAPVGKAIGLMKKNLKLPLTNTTLGREVFLHPNSFVSMFRKNTGQSPQSFYTRLRIDEACRLLHHTGKTIDEIASATGFCDRYHFSRVFKKVRQMSPAAFRKGATFQKENRAAGI